MRNAVHSMAYRVTFVAVVVIALVAFGVCWWRASAACAERGGVLVRGAFWFACAESARG